MTELLKIDGLKVSVGGAMIIKGISLCIQPGEVHVLMGPNGSGKSTLVNAVMGNPVYTIEEGSIFFDGQDVTDMPVNERAKAGLFMSFQNPPEVPGISMESFLRSAQGARSGAPVKLFSYKKELREKMDALQMDSAYAARELNVGFSGGEKKKAEILQLLMMKPKLAILDETDSGLDVDAVKTVSRGVHDFKNNENGLLVITHNTKILEYLPIDYVHVLQDGHIVQSGGRTLIDRINENGFAQIGGSAV